MVQFDHERGICIIQLAGKPTVVDIKEKIVAMLEHPEHLDGMDEIWDFREAAMTGFAARDLQALALFAGQHTGRIARRTALVVGRNVDYGIGRMWEAYAEEPAPQLRRLFRNMEDAFDWLAS